MSLQQNNLKCTRCGKKSLVTDVDSGEIFCSKCGFVIPEKISDASPERIFSDSNPNKSRTGDKTSLTRHDHGLSTMISPINKDSAGNPISISMKSTLSRLRKHDSRSRIKNNNDRNLQQALAELLKIKEKLALPEAVSEKAAYIYRKALEKGLVRGRSISALMASSLYAACRESETPRTLKEVAECTGVKRKEISASYRLIFRELELKMPVIDIVSCISKIASNVDVSEKTKRHAAKILKKAEKEHELSGKEPMGLAAAALYLSCIENNEMISQDDMAKAANVTPVTIRNRSKPLRRHI